MSAAAGDAGDDETGTGGFGDGEGADDTGIEAAAVDVDRSPTRLGSAVALGAALLVVAVAAVHPVSLTAAGLGVAVLAAGLLGEGSRRRVSIGAGATLVGALLAGGLAPVPAGLLLPAVAAALVAWDVGQNAVGLGQQIGAGPRSGRAELLHVMASLAAATVVSGLSYAVYRLVGGGSPVTAIALLVGGAVLLTWGLD